MSSEDSRLLYVLTDLVLPLMVGYFLHRRHILSDRGTNFLIRLNVRGIYTLLTTLSFWVIPISWSLALMVPYATLYVLVPGAIGALTFARCHKNLLNRGAYIMSAMISNIGTLGGVCTFIIYAEVGFAYSQIIATCQNVLLVLVCFPLAQYYRNKHLASSHPGSGHTSFREMFLSWNQLSLLGIALGLGLNVGGIERPEVLSHVVPWLVHIGAWTALLPVGYLFNFSHMRYYYNRLWDLAVLRFLVMPVFIWYTSRFLFDDPILLNSLLICAAAPTAINAVLTSRLYKLNVDLAITSFFATTVLFLLIIFPAMFFLLRAC